MKSIRSRDGWTDYIDNCILTFSGFSLFNRRIFLIFFFFFNLGSLVRLFFFPGLSSFIQKEQTGNKTLKSFGGLMARMHALEERNPCDIFAA